MVHLQRKQEKLKEKLKAMSPQEPSKDQRQITYHVLLVEHDTARRQVFYSLLNQQGFSIYTVASGEMAMTVLDYEWPDLILLNPTVSDMKAVELIRKIRACRPGIPIILLGDADVNGSIVQARLPFNATKDQVLGEVNHWLATPQTAKPQQPAGTVLLVDDEPRMATITQHLLEINGFSVLIAVSAEEGLSWLERRLPDAVLMDIRMPGMDGLVALKKIRATHPDLPVVLLTHVDEDSAREEAKRLGATGYITKPFNFEALKQVLKQAIAPKKSPQ